MRKPRLRLVLLISARFRCSVAAAAVPIYDVDVVHVYPHDVAAFTEGLFYLDGYLYESTGLEGRSTIRKVRLQTGAVVQKAEVPAQYFGEGIVNWGRRLVSLTWKSHVGKFNPKVRAAVAAQQGLHCRHVEQHDMPTPRQRLAFDQ